MPSDFEEEIEDGDEGVADGSDFDDDDDEEEGSANGEEDSEDEEEEAAGGDGEPIILHH